MAIFSGPGNETGSDDRGLTILASGIRVIGELQTAGVVKVEGTVEGTIRAEHCVVIARGGLVEGDVYTREAVIGGEVRGNVFAEERIEVQPGSRIHGNIVAPRVSIQEGGEVNGQLSMKKPEAAAARTPKPVERGPQIVAVG